MASVNPYRYAGYRYDEETKLYYLMARYYNPDKGVFLSLDPVRGDTMNPITMNGYNYANNNPVMMVDPDGEKALSLNRLKLSLRYGLTTVVAQYIGWTSADQAISGIVGLIYGIAGSIKGIAAGIKQYQSYKKVITTALKKSKFMSKSFKKKLEKALMKSARKLSAQKAARLVGKSVLGGANMAIFVAATIYGYTYKFRSVK